MLKRLERLTTETVHKNPYWEYRHDRYRLRTGEESDYYYASTKGSVFVVPRLDNNSFVLLRQYRYLNKRDSLEFPGGGLKAGLDLESNARSELREEAGFEASNLVLLGENNPCNGLTNELCSVFLASGLTVCETQPDNTEEFETVILTEQGVINLIQRGEIWDGMTLAAWSHYYFSHYRLHI
jgi:ADP-ribose pyrophosphatase